MEVERGERRMKGRKKEYSDIFKKGGKIVEKFQFLPEGIKLQESHKLKSSIARNF